MPSCKIGEVSIGLHGRLVTKHNFVSENGAFCWPPPPYAAAAGQNGHAAAAAKLGSARRRRRPSGLETPPPTLKWSAHRSGAVAYYFALYSLPDRKLVKLVQQMRDNGHVVYRWWGVLGAFWTHCSFRRKSSTASYNNELQKSRWQETKA